MKIKVGKIFGRLSDNGNNYSTTNLSKGNQTRPRKSLESGRVSPISSPQPDQTLILFPAAATTKETFL